MKIPTLPTLFASIACSTASLTVSATPFLSSPAQAADRESSIPKEVYLSQKEVQIAFKTAQTLPHFFQSVLDSKPHLNLTASELVLSDEPILLHGFSTSVRLSEIWTSIASSQEIAEKLRGFLTNSSANGLPGVDNILAAASEMNHGIEKVLNNYIHTVALAKQQGKPVEPDLLARQLGDFILRKSLIVQFQVLKFTYTNGSADMLKEGFPGIPVTHFNELRDMLPSEFAEAYFKEGKSRLVDGLKKMAGQAEVKEQFTDIVTTPTYAKLAVSVAEPKLLDSEMTKKIIQTVTAQGVQLSVADKPLFGSFALKIGTFKTGNKKVTIEVQVADESGNNFDMGSFFDRDLGFTLAKLAGLDFEKLELNSTTVIAFELKKVALADGGTVEKDALHLSIKPIVRNFQMGNSGMAAN